MRRRRPRHLNARSRRLIGEALEPRRLLATLNAGLLEILGTAGNESVTVTRDGAELVVTTDGGGTQRFARADVTSIRASMGDGNDLIAIADDVIVPASLQGGAGDDTLRGGGGKDTLDGGAGLDTVLYAGRGVGVVASIAARGVRPEGADDHVFRTVGTGGAEGDVFADVETIVGGDGDDTLSIGSESSVTLIRGPGGALAAFGGAGDDRISVSGAYSLDDGTALRAFGDAGDDLLSYSATLGGALLNGGDGNDRFVQASDDSGAVIQAGAGRDTLDLDNQPGINGFTIPLGLEVVNATAPNVRITGNAEANEINVNAIDVVVDGMGGDDRITVTGARGSDANVSVSIQGGEGNDTLVGFGGDDTILGGGGDDLIDGGGGDDSLVGGAGDDALIGGDGDDTIEGGDGDDRMDGGAGDDALDGGGGLGDVVSYATRKTPIVAALFTVFRYPPGYPDEDPDATPAGLTSGTGGEADEADRFANVEVVVGGAGNDSLTLDARIDLPAGTSVAPLLTRIEGRGGDDLLTVAGADAGSGPSTLGVQVADGGAGNDRLEFLFNAAAATTLIGGDGDDTFYTGSDDGRATIDAGAGRDVARFDANLGPAGFAMPDGLEDFVCTVFAGTVTGNGLDNVIDVASASLVEGAGGHDRITITGDVGGGVATLRGGNGNDTIRGGAAGDRIEGNAGDDRLYGNAGNDTILGGSGNDLLDGAAGADSLNGEANEDSLFGGDGNDVLLGGSGHDALDPGLGDDVIDGGDGADALTYESRTAGSIVGSITATLVATGGGGFAVRLRADAGDALSGERDGADNVEVLTGSGGDDTLDLVADDVDWAAAPGATGRTLIRANGVGGADKIRIVGRPGIPFASGGTGVATTVPMIGDGGAGDDSLAATYTGESSSTLIGGDGDDAFAYEGHAGFTTFEGGGGRDIARVTRRDLLDSGDVVIGEAQFVNLLMAEGLEDASIVSDGRVGVLGNGLDNVIAVTTTGRDITVNGGAGDDRILIGSSTTVADGLVDGGDGDDYVESSNLVDSLRGGNGDDTLYGGAESDKLWGGEGNDRLVGGGGKDVLRGEAGRDTLLGFSGSDKLYGGPGNDRLDGGDDNDTLDGEAGRDTVYGGNGRDVGRRDKNDRIFSGIEELL